jgi:hypothetical protein
VKLFTGFWVALELYSIFLEVWCLVACDALTLWCRVGEPKRGSTNDAS